MKIQLASDLHLEFLQSASPRERLIAPACDADVLVLAGDIACGLRAIELFGDWPVPVLYVAGNHEFYGFDFVTLRKDLVEAGRGTSVRFLDDETADFGGVRFLGATLWTDYLLCQDVPQALSMERAERGIADHSRIRHGRGWFSPADALTAHQASRCWLEQALSRPYDGRTVVITHHGPHCGSVHPRYSGDLLNSSFVSDLSELVPKASLWVHGHVHDSFDYRVQGCRVVANPLGYPRGTRSAMNARGLRFENSGFQWACVLEV
jgi:predicted phosphodiesterase